MTPFDFTGPYSHASLVERAVRNARPHGFESHVRWSCVAETFGLGSTMSTRLCEAFGLNPHEVLDGVTCPRCEDEMEEERQQELAAIRAEQRAEIRDGLHG